MVAKSCRKYITQENHPSGWFSCGAPEDEALQNNPVNCFVAESTVQRSRAIGDGLFVSQIISKEKVPAFIGKHFLFFRFLLYYKLL